MVRRLVSNSEFIEVFVDTPIEDCMQRDPKGLYAKAKAGKIKHFTGVDAPYEAPINPEIHLKTFRQSAGELAGVILRALIERDIIETAAS
jgi:bifunctional enzyme CysN/CysC